jgi:hypothetical protein
MVYDVILVTAALFPPSGVGEITEFVSRYVETHCNMVLWLNHWICFWAKYEFSLFGVV